MPNLCFSVYFIFLATICEAQRKGFYDERNRLLGCTVEVNEIIEMSLDEIKVLLRAMDVWAELLNNIHENKEIKKD